MTWNAHHRALLQCLLALLLLVGMPQGQLSLQLREASSSSQSAALTVSPSQHNQNEAIRETAKSLHATIRIKGPSGNAPALVYAEPPVEQRYTALTIRGPPSAPLAQPWSNAAPPTGPPTVR